jgi:hypothetical protein
VRFGPGASIGHHRRSPDLLADDRSGEEQAGDREQRQGGDEARVDQKPQGREPAASAGRIVSGSVGSGDHVSGPVERRGER